MQMVRVVSKLPTIRLQKDFRRIFAKGRRFGSRHLTAIVAAAGETGVTRMAYVVSKKVGGAVRRNRVRRRLREAARDLLGDRCDDRDIILIAKPGAEKVGYWSLHEQLAELLARAGVLEPDSNRDPCSHED